MIYVAALALLLAAIQWARACHFRSVAADYRKRWESLLARQGIARPANVLDLHGRHVG